MNDNFLKQKIIDSLFKNGEYDRRRVRSNKELICSLEEIYGKCKSKTELVYRAFFDASPTLCECGNTNNFISWTSGYSAYCSNECTRSSEKVKLKRVESIKATSLRKYGVTNVLSLPSVRKKVSETIFARYGVDNYTKSADFKLKVEKTSIERYGESHPLKCDAVRQKIKETMIEKYGAETTLQSAILKEKMMSTMLERYGASSSWNSTKLISKLHEWQKKRYQDRAAAFLTIENIGDSQITGRHSCGNTVSLEYFAPLKCKFCKKSSVPEQEIFEFVQSITKNVIRNDRKILAPKEIDIFVPEHNVGIEVNGAYWHHDKSGKIALRHKSERALSNNVKLLHFWDYEWLNKRNIVENLIRAALGKFERRIGARKTTVREIPSSKSIEFLNQYHLHGTAKAKYHFGIFDKDELIAVLTLGKPRFKNIADLEVIRLCYKGGVQVIGGLSKFISFAKSKVTFNTIFTYVDLRIADGTGFKKAGFKEIGTTDPGYVWFNKNVGALKRHLTMKSNLHNILTLYDSTISEDANMRNAGFLKLIDCGNKKLLLTIKI